MPNNAPEPRPKAQSVPGPVATGTTPTVAADGCAEAGRDARPAGRRDACPTVPDHELIRRIGRGSYGEVWLARNIMGEYRAVKIVYRESFDSDRPYEREFHGIRQFEPISRSHPSQVNILHVGKGDGCFYYVMELADQAEPKRSDGVAECWSDGPIQNAPPSLHDSASYVPRTLKSELAERGRLPAGESLEIGLALTTALEHLHQHGLVHRDVKPSNVIFVNGIPKLADIGLVTGADVTRSFVGTEGFIPPEGPGTPQADIYGLGKVLYEISTGKDRHNFPEPPTLLAELGDRQELLELDEIIQRACASDPRQRYQSAAAMHEDLLLLKAGKSVRRVHGIERKLALLTRVSISIGVVLVVVVPGYLFALHEKKQAVLAAGRATAAEQAQVRLRQEAESDRRQAEMDKAKALNEAAKSQQVAKFLEDMLHGVGPAVAKGRDTTLLKEILDKTVERMGKDLAEQPEVELELRNTLAGVYEQLGLYQDLEELACENVQLARSRLGTESVALASALNRSALASLRAGHLSQAEQFAVEALTMRRKLLGNENEDVAVTLQILGAVLSNAGRLSEAEAIDREGLALRQRLLGSEDPDVAIMWSNLSLVLLGQGKLKEAEACAREALAINRKHLGPAHPWLATSINNLGLVLKNEARFAEAEALYRESLAMDVTVNGTNHPVLLRCFLNLASVLEAQGKFEEAETLQRQGLDLAPKLSGRDDGALAASLDSLGSMLQRQGKLAEAEALYRQAYAIRKRLAGDEQLQDPRFLFRLAGLREVQGKLAEAETLHRQALALRQKSPGNNYLDLVNSMEALGTLLVQAGKFTEAETLLRETLAIRKQRSGEDHPDVASSLAALGHLLCDEDQPAEAEPLLRECLDVRQKKLPNDWLTFNTQSLLGGSLVAQQKYAEAEPLLLAGYQGMKEREDKIARDNKVRVKEALQRLVQLFDETGRADRAAECKQKLAEFEKVEDDRKTSTVHP